MTFSGLGGIVSPSQVPIPNIGIADPSGFYRTFEFWNRLRDRNRNKNRNTGSRSEIAEAIIFLNVSVPLLIDLYENRSRQEDKKDSFPNDGLPNFDLPVNETFDFIIVGAGSAGSILARRLSDNAFTVLLLEAGGDPPPLQMIPTIVSFTKVVPSIHWEFQTTRQRFAALKNKGIIKFTAGKMMGGSGSHNNCQYERGHPYDYDNWANVTGDDSWKFENVLKYFKKSENYQGQFTTQNSSGPGQHAEGGLIDVVASNVTFRDDVWFSAGEELGFKVNIDSNGPQQVGFSPVEYNRRNGRRSAAYVDYIRPIEGHCDNLVIRKYSIVSEILFDGTQAIGVRYERHGIPRAAFASKEVIVSAGAHISPVLLMRSGIGPKDQLDEAGIKPVAILPVGENLQDHIRVVMPVIKVEDKSVFKYSMANISFDEFNKFVETGEGFFSAFSSLHEAFIASKIAAAVDKKPDWPDLQLYLGHDFDDEDVLTCRVNINRPTSRGRITLNMTATKLEEALIPVIDYKFFERGTDYDVAMEGIDYCVKIVESTKTFQNIGAKFSPKLLPECQFLAFFGIRNYKYWRCYIQHMTETSNHIAGSNRMGKSNDPLAVVDSKLRVRGISGLRVIDASVMPFVTNANVNAAVFMIAEKSADGILNQWMGTKENAHLNVKLTNK